MAPIRKLLIANRGEIARRIMRTARAMGQSTVAVYADGDAESPFVREADEAVALHGVTAAESYLDVSKLVAAAMLVGADAVHPGYGFLSENAAFARAVLAAGLRWVGPAPDTIASMGDKLAAKKLMAEAGVPTLPSLAVADLAAAELARSSASLGYPLLVKAAAGGGGKGMRIVRAPGDLADAVSSARREARSAFGDDTVFLEPYLESPRHVEIQILGDGDGHLIHLLERECSVQRRYQKIVEESPSPALDAELRERMCGAAVAAGRAIGYVSAGTVEFMLDRDGRFYFLEVNTRLQVEHPVTEAVTGLDLVREQLRVAEGHCLGRRQQDVTPTGHAIEVRLYAEDPAHEFLPAPGRVLLWSPPTDPPARFDAGVESGSEVSAHFDPLLAKIIVHAPTRAEAAYRLARVLERLRVHGVTTNRDFLVGVLRHPVFLDGRTTTDFIDRHQLPRVRAPEEAELRVAVLAAALFDEAGRRRAARVLAAVPSGWRNNPSAMQQASYRHGSREIAVEYRRERDGRFAWRVGGCAGHARVQHAGEDGLDLEVDSVRRHLAILAHGGERWVQAGTGDIHLLEVPRFPVAEPETVAGGHVAPTPGQVVEISVAVGEHVVAGQKLVAIEAMKVEHHLLAMVSGRVQEIRVEVGSQVEAGQMLVILQTEESGP